MLNPVNEQQTVLQDKMPCSSQSTIARAKRKAAVAQIFNKVVQKNISEHNIWNVDAEGLQQQNTAVGVKPVSQEHQKPRLQHKTGKMLTRPIIPGTLYVHSTKCPV